MAFDMRAPKKLSAGSPSIARRLLPWYERHARALPWRNGPGETSKRPDPYHVWLSEIMLQQTRVATVTPRFQEFVARWPDVSAMAAAPLDDVLGAWAGLGYYARARNLHKCATVIANDHGGFFPDTEEELRKLPGIGDYTAAAIAAIAFDKPAVVVDGNIERVVSRLFAIATPLPKAKPEIKARAAAIWPQRRSGDFAQALMDLGAGVCRPKAPACMLCPLSEHCEAHSHGREEAFPIKPPKKQKPTRQGAAFALFNGRGELLLERRPEKGLLGGMLGLPGTAWAESLPNKIVNAAPAKTKWKRIGEIEHTFTHFHLVLEVHTGVAPRGFRRGRDQLWVRPNEAQLPTVMKKAVGLASKHM